MGDQDITWLLFLYENGKLSEEEFLELADEDEEEEEK